MIGNIKHFRFWCQKVIPLVYDNSLSYYEVLCKIVHYLNHVIEDINEIPEYIDEKVKEAIDDNHLRELISEIFRTLEDAISNNNEGTNTHFSKDYPTLGTLLWHDNKLYKTIRKIDRGDEVIPDVNIELVNFGDMFNDFIDEVKKNFTEYDDGKRETASMDRPVHQLVWLDDVLYEVIKPITEGNAYIYSGDNKNVEPITMDYMYQYIIGLIADEAQTRASEDARIELELGDLITSRVNAEAETRAKEDARIELELGELITSRVNAEAETRAEEDARIELELRDLFTSMVSAEAEIRQNADTALQNQIGNLENLSTIDKTNLVSAINELDTQIAGLFDKADIRNYGGVADNATDCTNAFNLCMSDNNMVYMPNYNNQAYLLRDITLTTGQSVIGTEGTTINTNAPILFTITGSNVDIKNLIINSGNSIFYIDSNASALSFIHIENVYSYGASTFLYDNANASHVYTNLYMNRCAARMHKGSGISVKKAYAFLMLTDITIDCVSQVGISPCFFIQNNYGAHLVRCEAEGGYSDGTHSSHSGFNINTCQAIWFERCMADTVDSTGFNIVNSQYIYLNGCVSSLNGAHGIAVIGTTSRHVLINNCLLAGRRGMASSVANAYGLYNFGECVNVSNCNIQNFTGYAFVNATDGNESLLSNISMYDCGHAILISSGGGLMSNIRSNIEEVPSFGNIRHRNCLFYGTLYDTPLGS